METVSKVSYLLVQVLLTIYSLIKEISGEMPHPNGRIVVRYKVQNGIIQAEIILPEHTNGTLVWKNKNYPLKGGNNYLKL